MNRVAAELLEPLKFLLNRISHTQLLVLALVLANAGAATDCL